jgi:hypothetical protein
MKRLRGQLTYSNVMVTILAILVLGGGTAYATQMLPKNSVGSKQLKKGAVTPTKLSKAVKKALTGPQSPAGGAGSGALPHARIRLRSREQTLGSNEAARVDFDEVVEDNAGMADVTNHPTTLLATRSGLYLVAANLEWHELEGEGRVGGSILVPNPDGVGFAADKGESVFDYVGQGVLQYLGQPFSETIRLEAGQYVTLDAYQITGATNHISNVDDGTWLEMTYLGP